MTYPQGYPQQGYPQQAPPGYYPPQPPQQPYYGPGPQGYPQQPPQQPPQPERAPSRFTGVAFGSREKRPSISFKDLQPVVWRTLVCDLDPVVVHKRGWTGDNTLGPLEYWDEARTQPKYVVGTGVIGEDGNDYTHWCGHSSNCSAAYTKARAAVGLGPEDSMAGWVIALGLVGTAPGKGNEKKLYEVRLIPIEQAGQFLTPAQAAAAQRKGITHAEPPGNRKNPAAQAEADNQAQAAANVPNGQYTGSPPVHTGSAPGQPAQNGGYGYPSPAQYGPPQGAPPQPYAPQQAPGWPPQGAPGGYPQQAPGGYPPQQPPNGPYAAPQQTPAPFGGGAPQGSPPPAYGSPQQPHYPSAPGVGAAPFGDPSAMGAAVHTVTQTFPGATVASSHGPGAGHNGQSHPDEVNGFTIAALAAYAKLPDQTLVDMALNKDAVREAITIATQMGALPGF